MDTLIGTSGFSYKQWKGAFYPSDVSPDEMLRHYADKFVTVEINNTFYRMPRSEILERWTSLVPERFKFVIKASRRITHQNRLKNADSNVEYLYGKLATLGDRLGAVLYQLPPNMRVDVGRLETFLGMIPGSTPAAFEFRHDSWFCEDVYQLLRSHGAVLCAADHDPEQDLVSAPLVETANWGYLRLRRVAYDDAELHAWLDRLNAHSSAWDRAFVFFMHEEGDAPTMATRFAELLVAG